MLTKYKISRFRRLTASVAHSYSTTWSDFSREFTTITYTYSRKDDVPLWSPVTFSDDRRSNRTAVEASMMVADLDDVTEEQFARVIDTVTNLGWACIVHTTWSHSEAAARLRLIVPLASPIAAADYARAWHGFASIIGTDVIDTQCKDLARFYYIPAMPEGNASIALAELMPGEPAEPSQIMAAAPAAAAETPRAASYSKVPTELYRKLIRKLARSNKVRDTRIQTALERCLKGLPFAEDGDRDNTTFELAGYLARNTADVTPEAHQALFERSCDAMSADRPDDPWTWENHVLPKLVRAYRPMPTDAAPTHARVSWSAEEIQDRLRQAFGADRGGYTPEELESWGMDRDCKKWILCYDSRVFIFWQGSYLSGHPARTAQQYARQRLLPAPLDLDTFNAKTGRFEPKTIGQLTEEYGTVVDHVEYDLAAQNSYLREGDLVLVQAPCPMKPIQAREHKEVGRWLEALAGDDIDALERWIYWLWDLSRPCAALLLAGAGGAGKTLLANGLSKLWADAPTPYAEVCGGNWNDSLLQCPLVLADETIPKDNKGAPRTDELREFIARYKGPLKKRYESNAQIHGAARVILTSNNLDIFDSPQELSQDDIRAIADRILYLPVPESARAYLEETDVTGWVDDLKIAEHSAWIRDKLGTVKPAGRFLVTASDPHEMTEIIRAGSNLRAKILEFFISYVKNPERAAGPDLDRGLTIKDGAIRCTPAGVAKMWGRYTDNERAPSPRALRRALEGLSERTVNHGGVRTSYIDMTALQNWSIQIGALSAAEFRRCLAAAERGATLSDIDTRPRIDPYVLLNEAETFRPVTDDDLVELQGLLDAAGGDPEIDLRVLLFLSVYPLKDNRITRPEIKRAWSLYLPEVQRPKLQEITRTLDKVGTPGTKNGNLFWVIS